jgi:hypothetical protein
LRARLKGRAGGLPPRRSTAATHELIKSRHEPSLFVM